MMGRDILKTGQAEIRSASGWLALILVSHLLIVFPSAAIAQSLMSEAEVRQTVEDRYGVEVLRVDPAERDGIPVFLTKVMNPGGNYNEAFQVNVLVIDRRNGEPIPQFRHGASGVRDPADGPREVPDDSGRALREGTFR